jgi:hypothetical protein
MTYIPKSFTPIFKEFTPSVAGVANVDSVTVTNQQNLYVQLGDYVLVKGEVDVNPTTNTGGPTTQFSYSLPIASNVSTTYQAGVMTIDNRITSKGATMVIRTTDDDFLVTFAPNEAQTTFPVTFWAVYKIE